MYVCVCVFLYVARYVYAATTSAVVDFYPDCCVFYVSEHFTSLFCIYYFLF